MDIYSLILPQSMLVVPQSRKSSPCAGGPPLCFQAAHMVTACPRASTKQHGPSSEGQKCTCFSTIC